MSELRECPFCKNKKWNVFDANHYACEYCGAVVGFAFINYHPLEDSLHSDNKKLREALVEIAEYSDRWTEAEIIIMELQGIAIKALK